MSRRGVPAAVAVGVLMLAVLCGCGAPPPPQASPRPLRILLVDPAGWTAAGLAPLRRALTGAGHTVVEVSPLTDARASGTSLTMPPVEMIAGPPTGDPAVWAVSGTASDAAMLGLHSVMGDTPPDLVIVGIDSRPNVSLAALQSGTVGAALTSAAAGYPTIALSAALRDGDRSGPPSFAAPAAFASRLVGVLSRHPAGAPLMPLHSVLNVNYPGGPPQGVVAAKVADGAPAPLYYRTGSRPGTVVAVPVPLGTSGSGRDDVQALADGHVTLSDLSANPDRTEPPPRLANRIASSLQP